MSARALTIIEDFQDILSEITVDGYSFRATWNPANPQACILWLRVSGRTDSYEALGQFSRFNKRSILDFIARYATSPEMRREVGLRRLQARIDSLPSSFFEELGRMPTPQKRMAFRNLFQLDSMVDQPSLALKRRMLARRFHPDAGGSNRYMTLINEAYEYLSAGR